MERLLSVASPLGLYAEEFDAEHRAAPRQLPAGVLAPRADRGRRADHPRRATRGVHDEPYDVIVIGSGAGGGTLVHRLAPSGKRILLLERGDWLPREPQNWSAADVFVDNRYISARHLVRRGDGQGLPAAGALLRGRRDQALRRRALPPARGGLRRAAPPRRRLAGVADRLRRAWSPTTRRPSSSTRCTERAARTRPSRPPARPTLPGGLATSRASSSSPTTSRRPATSRSTRPAASCSTRRTWRTAPASAAPPATAFRAWSTRSRTPRCWRCGRRSSTRT